MNSEIYIRMLKCVHQISENKTIIIYPESRFQEDLEMGSLQIVLLQVAVEEEFGFTFDPLDDNFNAIFQTVQSLCDFIASKVT